jgi:PAS domain S-box-containing protein
VWLDLSLTALPGADGRTAEVMMTLADITESKQLESHLRQRNERISQLYASISQSQSNLNAILQSMMDGVIALDNDEQIIFINQPLFDLLGIERVTAREWVGRPVEELQPLLSEIWTMIQSSGEANEVVRVAVELEEPPRALELLHTPILDDQGGRIGYLLLLHDITQVRANERMKDELLSVLSHELRTPLTSILGYAKLLVDRPDSLVQKRARWASLILDKSRLLNRLINEVLDLTRLNAQHLSLQLSPCDLKALVERILEEQRVNTTRHELRAEVPTGLNEIVLDVDRIDQLLTNLVINAIKYSPEGGVITVRLTRGEHDIEIAVQDEGIGIPPEYHERIFEPFFRVDNSTTRAVYGTGLGLPLCKGIAHAHGGELTVESQPGQGSIFHVRLPLRQLEI